MNNPITKTLVLFTIVVLLALVSAANVEAYSGYPSSYHPGSQYGMGARYYVGPWGEVMVYGNHGYFPNYNGQRPYGFAPYGKFYTVWDLRMGTFNTPPPQLN